jgi:hypothetical protein
MRKSIFIQTLTKLPGREVGPGLSSILAFSESDEK